MIGQFAGIAAVTAIAGLAALVSLIIPATYIGLLGFAPIAIGVRRLLGPRREEPAETRLPDRMGLWAMVAATMATGGDNIAVYTVMFATENPTQITTTASVCAVMTGLWCFLAHSIVNHPAITVPVRRWGPAVLPFVMIGIGLLVVYKAHTLRLVGL